MKYFHLILVFTLICSIQFTVSGQTSLPAGSATPKLSQKLTAALDRANESSVDPVRRTSALATFLKAQRQIRAAARQRTMLENVELRNAAKVTLLAALEKDPTISEGYTMLAELELTSQGQNVSEAMAFTDLAIRANPANFGSRRLQARIFTRTSRITETTFDRATGMRAIAAWKEVAKLDPLNAEAWAFLGKLYELTGQPEQQVEALRKWNGSPAALDSGFYRAVLGREADLTPEAASIGLAAVLIKRNLAEEAVDILTRILIDDPENKQAVDLVAKAVETEPKANLDKIARKLRTALSSNPGNAALARLVEKVNSSRM